MHRASRVALLAAVLLIGGAALHTAVVAPRSAAAAPERPGAVDATLTGLYRTDHFDVRYRPGSRAGASAERTGAVAERDLDRICRQLDVKNDTRYVLFLFDDVADICAVTRTTGHGGFSADDASYVAYAEDQTRAHELVHIVAKAKLPRTGDEPRSLFFAEGIANALLEHVHGVHVHAVAKWYRKAGRLPRIAEMTTTPDFYEWLRAHPGLNAYDVAASWMRFLLDAHGVAKVRQYYGGKPAKAAFGSDLETIEKAWLAALDRYELRPEVDALLKLRHGESEPAVASAWLAETAGWAALQPSGAERTWTAKGDALTGASDSSRWSVYEFDHELRGDCAVSSRVTIEGPCGVQLRLGVGNQAMLLPGGTFVYRDEASVAATQGTTLPASPATFTLAIVRRRSVFEVWLDGKRALATEAAPGAARVGIGVVGRATFESVRVRATD